MIEYDKEPGDVVAWTAHRERDAQPQSVDVAYEKHVKKLRGRSEAEIREAKLKKFPHIAHDDDEFGDDV